MKGVKQTRFRIPLLALKKLRYTEKWSREETLSLVVDWNNGVSYEKMAEKYGVSVLSIRNRAHYIYDFRNVRSRQYKKNKAEGFKRPPDEHRFAGIRKCIECQKDFHSWHIRKNQRCDSCKAGSQIEESSMSRIHRDFTMGDSRTDGFDIPDKFGTIDD